MTATASRVDITAVKARHSLAAVVESAGVKLQGTGRVRQGVCPFHDEAEGSFTVYGDSQRWYCFGCGEGGDVLDFIQRTESVPLSEALQLLGGAAALAPLGKPRETPEHANPPPARDRAVLTAATRFYTGRLLQSADALSYLSGRGIAVATAMALRLGFAPGAGLRESLLATGFDGERVARSGLFTERGAERFAGMIVVPDGAHGRVRWLGGRAINPGARPRFQALTGSKANPRLGAHAPRCPLGHRDGGDVRLADARAVGPARLCRPRNAGAGTHRAGGLAIRQRVRRVRQGRRRPGRRRAARLSIGKAGGDRATCRATTSTLANSPPSLTAAPPSSSRLRASGAGRPPRAGFDCIESVDAHRTRRGFSPRPRAARRPADSSTRD